LNLKNNRAYGMRFWLKKSLQFPFFGFDDLLMGGNNIPEHAGQAAIDWLSRLMMHLRHWLNFPNAAPSLQKARAFRLKCANCSMDESRTSTASFSRYPVMR
jgi:hypothetical protein